jgi:hypothetical protein
MPTNSALILEAERPIYGSYFLRKAAWRNLGVVGTVPLRETLEE